jgi:RNA polymerase sigma-70 factor (ECF subfamily)
VAQRELVERARRGDLEAFDALALAAIGRLDGAARLILRDPDQAKDAVQEAFAKAWRDLRSLRDPDRFDAWLHRLLVHACYDELRRRRSRPIEVEISPIHDSHVPDSQSQTADRDALERAMRGLDTDLRAIVVLFYYLDTPLPEAAHALGVPLGTAKSRLHRARRELRDAFGVSDAGQEARFVEGTA